MSNRLTIIVSVILVFFSCQQTVQRPLTDSDRQEIADIIRKESNNWLNSITEATQENLDVFLGYFVQSDDSAWMNKPALWVSNFDSFLTTDQLESFWRRSIDQRTAHNMSIREGYVAVLSEDIAVHVFPYDYEIIDTQGEILGDGKSITTNVYVKRDGKWKIMHHHQTYGNK